MVYKINFGGLFLFIYLTFAIFYAALHGAEDVQSLASVLLVVSSMLFPPGYEVEIANEKNSDKS